MCDEDVDLYEGCNTILVAQSYECLAQLTDEQWMALGARLSRNTQRIGTSPDCPPGQVFLMDWEDWKRAVGLA